MVNICPITSYTYIKSTFKSANLFICNLVKRLKQANIQEPACMHIKLCVTEALANAIMWGNKNDSSKTIYLRYCICNNCFSITIEDQGSGFDVKMIGNPLDNINLLRESGRGILFMNSFMSSVTFNEIGNKVTLVKQFTSC